MNKILNVFIITVFLITQIVPTLAGEKDFSRAMNGEFGVGTTDFSGRQSYSTIYGEQVVGSHIDDISIQFQYNNSTNDLTIFTPTGTGSQSNNLSMMRVSAGTGVGDQRVESLGSVRYRPGHEVITHFTARFVGADLNVDHHIGIGDEEDEVSIGSQDGVFGVVFKENSNSTFIPQSSFSSDKIDGSKGLNNSSGFKLVEENLNTFMITYGWLGTTPISYYVYGGFSLGWILFHTIDVSNIDQEPHLQNPSLPMHIEVTRSAGTGAESYVETASWRAGAVGGGVEEDNTSNRWSSFFNIDVNVISTAGTGSHMISMRSKSLFQGKTNHVRSLVQSFILASSHNKDLIVAAYPTAILRANDAVFAAALDAAYVDVDTENSVLQVAKLPVSVDISGLLESDIVDLALVQALRINSTPNVKGFNIYPTSEFSIVILPPGSGTGTVSLQGQFKELF